MNRPDFPGGSILSWNSKGTARFLLFLSGLRDAWVVARSYKTEPPGKWGRFSLQRPVHSHEVRIHQSGKYAEFVNGCLKGSIGAGASLAAPL